MQQVADAAGVHRTTVSLALRHHPSIPEKTRRRLIALAEKMGYRPNPMVSALMSQLRSQRPPTESQVIAYVTAHPADTPWRKFVSLREMFAGAQARAAALGFTVQEFDLQTPGMSGGRMKNILLARGIRGVLLAPLPYDWTTLDFDVSPFAAVALGLSLQSPSLERVASDHYQCMRLVFQECLRRGYRRIGFQAGEALSARLEGRWLAAYLYEQRALPARLRLKPSMVRDVPEWDGDDTIPWCRRERPEVIVSHFGDSDWRKFPAFPGAPGLVNLTRGINASNWAGVVQDAHRLGQIAVERLVARLQHNEIGPLDRIQNTMLHGEWADGDSLPASPPRR